MGRQAVTAHLPPTAAQPTRPARPVVPVTSSSGNTTPKVQRSGAPSATASSAPRPPFPLHISSPAAPLRTLAPHLFLPRAAISFPLPFFSETTRVSEDGTTTPRRHGDPRTRLSTRTRRPRPRLPPRRLGSCSGAPDRPRRPLLQYRRF